MVATKTMTLSTIRNGTVIDHIPAGYALKIFQLLGIREYNHTLSLGLNLPSSRMNHKDLIKIEEKELSTEEANRIAIFAPDATITIINDYDVTKKFQVAPPEEISGVINCPNPTCITNHEEMVTKFNVLFRRQEVFLECKYCKRVYSQEEVSTCLC